MAGLFSLLVGRTLRGRYRIERLISKGGMGAVFLAHDAELERPVAVKVIAMEPQSPEEEAGLRARFRREARAAARLQHPNVVTIYDVGTDETTGMDFIVMELLHGEDLQQRLRRAGPLPLPLALDVLHGAACGLGAGHRLGMVHRDVKPANLFLEQAAAGHPPRVRVLDFGIAQVLESGGGTVTKLTVYGGGPLSPSYAAPEQLRGTETLTPACDVFALGCTAYELLTGELPFDEAQRERMRRGEMVFPPRPGEGAVAALGPLGDVIHRALSPRPDDRPRDGDAFAAEVTDAAGAGTGSRRRAVFPAASGDERPERTIVSSAAADHGPWADGTGSRWSVDPEPEADLDGGHVSGPARRQPVPTPVAVAGGVMAVLAVILAVAPHGDIVTPADDPAIEVQAPLPVAENPQPADDVHYVSVRHITSPDGASGRFEPSVVHAHRGDVLRFTTDGLAAHNVSFPPAENARRELPPSTPYLTTPGQSNDVAVDLPPGTYHFECDPHAVLGETGTLIVS